MVRLQSDSRFSKSAVMHAASVVAIGVVIVCGQVSAKDTTYRPPRLADGHIDLQGVWTNVTLTPFERPIEVGEKAFYSKEEFNEQETLAERRMEDVYYPPEGVGTDNAAFFDKDRHLLPTRQTSLVVDPPNGRVPLRPDMVEHSDARAFSLDSYETITPLERCLSLGATTLFPKFTNSSYQIIQTPHWVVIHSEIGDDVRIVPLGDVAHSDARIRTWSGDSRGHWEGDTLVVDTTNFNSRGRIATSISQLASRNFPQTETLHTMSRCFFYCERSIFMAIPILGRQPNAVRYIRFYRF